MNRPNNDNRQRWLIGFYRGIGDAVCALPALRAIREQHPEVHISLAAGHVVAPIFAAAGIVNEIIIYKRFSVHTLRENISLIRRFRAERFDKIFVSPHAYPTGWKTVLSGLLCRTRGCELCGSAAGILSRFYTKGVAAENSTLAWRDLHFFKSCGIVAASPELHYPPLTFDNLDRTVVSLVARRKDSSGCAGIIGFHPGAGIKYRQWPLEYWQSLIAKSAAAMSESVFVLILGPEEKSIFAGEDFAANVVKVSTDVLSMVWLISKLDVLVSLDSGATHIAAMFQTPNVAMYGPKLADYCGPVNPNSSVLFKNIPCRTEACLANTCSQHRAICMECITTDEVFDAMVQRLDGRGMTSGAYIQSASLL